MSRKSLRGKGIPSFVGGDTAVPANRGAGATAGKSAGKAKRGKRTGGTLNTAAGKSKIQSPPIQGGYA